MALKKVENKVSLNIKIPQRIDARLKRARKAARDQGLMFNVSVEVEKFLEKELKKVEKDLGITQDIDESNNQLSLIEINTPKDEPKKVENKKPARTPRTTRKKVEK